MAVGKRDQQQGDEERGKQRQGLGEYQPGNVGVPPRLAVQLMQ